MMSDKTRQKILILFAILAIAGLLFSSVASVLALF
jgi:hypothetical protein